MRAAVLTAPGRVEVATFPVPRPEPGQLLVRMAHAAVCGSDLHVVFDGFHRDEYLGRPGYPGHEGVGVVAESPGAPERVGAPVLTLPSGWAGGCFAEYQLVDAGQAVPLEPGCDLRRLLFAQQLGATLHAFDRFLPGVDGVETALVTGAGPAGLFFLQLLLSRGVPFVAVADREERRLAEASRLGAQAVLRVPQDSVPDEVAGHTGGRGVDVAIEAAGYDDARADAVHAARDGGLVGLFGYPERPGASPLPVHRAFRRSLTLRWASGAQQEPGLAAFRTGVALISSGAVDVSHCLNDRFPLERAPEALAAARDRTVLKASFDLWTGGESQ